jgi:hypothetical protein
MISTFVELDLFSVKTFAIFFVGQPCDYFIALLSVFLVKNGHFRRKNGQNRNIGPFF